MKIYRGQLGVLEVPGRARGVMEFWRKWSFPFGSMRQADASPGWRLVHKVRRMTLFLVEGGQVSVGAGQPANGPGCAVELTEVTMLGRHWWTLGFEARG